MSIVLYRYFRSSAAYRVRIAWKLKNIEYEIYPVHLLKNGGEQYSEEYLALNPQGLVPVLIHSSTVLTQSSAIIEYLEEAFPNPPLLPRNPIERAYVRSFVQVIACDIHPLNNLRVLSYLKKLPNDISKQAWQHHWLQEGFSALEQLLQRSDFHDRFCFGHTASLADVFLIPQVHNALRFDFGMNAFPLINTIYKNCLQQSDFINARPENQPDAEPDKV
jgi:maleylacetoacetate isomerase